MSVDGKLGTQTQGGRMVGADESTELWRHPPPNVAGFLALKNILFTQEMLKPALNKFYLQDQATILGK